MECPVCYRKAEETELLLLECSHALCKTCFRRLLQYFCPMCRNPISNSHKNLLLNSPLRIERSVNSVDVIIEEYMNNENIERVLRTDRINRLNQTIRHNRHNRRRRVYSEPFISNTENFDDYSETKSDINMSEYRIQLNKLFNSSKKPQNRRKNRKNGKQHMRRNYSKYSHGAKYGR